MFVSEIGTEEPQVIAFIAQVVVNHVKDHGQADCVRGIDQTLEAVGTAIVRLHRVRRDAVITPITCAGGSCDRHDFNHGDAKLFQIRKFADGCVERAFRRKRANVEFVNHVVAQRQSAPGGVSPGEFFRIDNFGWAVDAFRQQSRHGIRHRLILINDVKVFVARAGKGLEREIAVGKLHRPIVRTLLVDQAQGDRLCRGRPDAEVAAIAGQIGAERGGGGFA